MRKRSVSRCMRPIMTSVQAAAAASEAVPPHVVMQIAQTAGKKRTATHRKG
jgi:hypothetical protein